MPCGVGDTNGPILYHCLARIRDGLDQPGSSDKIRAAASALAFCMSNNIVMSAEVGYTTAAVAANVAAGVFGRDDDESSPFVFEQQHVDAMLVSWSNIVSASGVGAYVKPSADTLYALELVISVRSQISRWCNCSVPLTENGERM